MHYIKLFVSISNQQCASSQFLWWILQPCFVLKSRPQKILKNFSSFPLSSGLFSIIVSRFGLLAVGLCSSGQQQSLHFHDFLSKVRYKMSSQMLLQTIKSQSGFKNANILQFVLANVTPIGPPEKCKVAIHAIQTVFVDPINVGSIVG